MTSAGKYLAVPAQQWAEALTSDDAIARRLATHALAEIGPEAQEALPALIEALEDSQAFVRVWAAAALARVDPSRPESFAALLAGLSDDKAFVRSLAAWHLGRVGANLDKIDEAVEAIRALLDDPNPSVRAEANLALKRLEGKGNPPPELQSLARGV